MNNDIVSEIEDTEHAVLRDERRDDRRARPAVGAAAGPGALGPRARLRDALSALSRRGRRWP